MSSITVGDAQSLLTEEFLRRFDTPGPRYTSYPTADRFAADFAARRLDQPAGLIDLHGLKALAAERTDLDVRVGDVEAGHRVDHHIGG